MRAGGVSEKGAAALRAWIYANREGVGRLLEPARSVAQQLERPLPPGGVDALGLEGYLRWRGALESPSAQAAWEHVYGRTIVSQTLTFPLTAARLLEQVAARGQPSEPLQLLVVGARAEASMPLHLWDEARAVAWRGPLHVVFVGPECGRATAQRVLSPDLRVSWHPDHLHAVDGEIAASREGAQRAFALFNPGLGAPHLRDLWKPTLRRIFASGARHPTLVSSLSDYDSHLDLAAVRSAIAAVDGSGAAGVAAGAGAGERGERGEPSEPTDPTGRGERWELLLADAEVEAPGAGRQRLPAARVNPFASRRGFADPHPPPPVEAQLAHANHRAFLALPRPL